MKKYKSNAIGGTFAFLPTHKAKQKMQKSHQANARQNRHEMTTKQSTEKEGRRHNNGFAKWRVQCFYDSLVQGSSSVFQMNICAENPPLRKAENRYAQCRGTDSVLRTLALLLATLSSATPKQAKEPIDLH